MVGQLGSAERHSSVLGRIRVNQRCNLVFPCMVMMLEQWARNSAILQRFRNGSQAWFSLPWFRAVSVPHVAPCAWWAGPQVREWFGFWASDHRGFPLKHDHPQKGLPFLQGGGVPKFRKHCAKLRGNGCFALKLPARHGVRRERFTLRVRASMHIDQLGSKRLFGLPFRQPQWICRKVQYGCRHLVTPCSQWRCHWFNQSLPYAWVRVPCPQAMAAASEPSLA